MSDNFDVPRLKEHSFLEDGVIVVLRMDAATEELQRTLHASLSERCGVDIIDFEPHITLAAYEKPPLDHVLSWIGDCAARHKSFEVRFSSFGFFPRSEEAGGRTILFLTPAAAPALTALYYEVHKRFDDYCGDLGWLYSMRYGHPAIHSTVHILPQEVEGAAAGYMLEHFSEVAGTAVAIEVHRWPMRLIQRFPLGG